MAREGPASSGERARRVSGLKIDTPALVVSMLTVFFATVFATLLALRPPAVDPPQPAQGAGRAEPVDQRAHPPITVPPPVDAAPPASAPRADPRPDEKPEPSIWSRLEQLGIRCAEGATCDPEALDGSRR